MKVEHVIISSILKYPTLYKDINFKYSKGKVLNHLFFTNGNGYEWFNGELGYCEDDEFQEGMVIPENYFDTTLWSKEEDEDGFFKKYREEQDESFVPREVCSKQTQNIYPICEYARILNIPDDIKPDWLNAAEEAYEIALDYYNDPYKHCSNIYIKDWVRTREYNKVHKYIAEQKHYLQLVKLRIDELKLDLIHWGPM